LNPIIGYYTGPVGEVDILPIIQNLIDKKRTADVFNENDLEIVDSEFPESSLGKILKPIVNNVLDSLKGITLRKTSSANGGKIN
jgi:hypothetical protein